MPLPADLKYFRWGEFHAPNAIAAEAAYFLDDVRANYDMPMVVTDDARTPEEQLARENALQGGAVNSLHVLGRAFDVRWPATKELLYRMVEAINKVGSDPKYAGRVELELDATAGNQHVHFGLRPKPSASSLVVRKAV